MHEYLERQRHIVAEHFALENAHRWAEVVDTFHSPHASFELIPAGARLSGKEGIAAAYHILSTALPDVQIRIVSQTDVLGCSVREIVVTGTHQGEYFGTAPSGRSVRDEMACFFLFDEAGELATERVYFDNGSLLAQMRGEPDAPRGVGL